MRDLGVFTFIPKFCPACGKGFTCFTHLTCKHESRREYLAGCSFSCDCGFRYQLVGRKDLLGITEDLAEFEKRDENA